MQEREGECGSKVCILPRKLCSSSGRFSVQDRVCNFVCLYSIVVACCRMVVLSLLLSRVARVSCSNCS